MASSIAHFVATYGHAPTIEAIAPGRVNIIGEHVDYSGGLVLPMAIDRHLAIAVAPRDGTTSIVHSTAIAEPSEFTLCADAAPAADGTLTSRLTAVARGVRRALGAEREQPWPQLSIAIDSTIPPGGGLSSSASLAVGFASVLAALADARLDALTVARLCRVAEREGAGVACGIMDPLVIAAGVEGHALLIDCLTESFEPIPVPRRAAWLVIDTGVRHDLAAGDYAIRQRESREAAAWLGVRDLREAAERGVEPKGALAHRARHAISEHTRTRAAVDALRAGDLRTLGAILLAGHASLRDDFQVSIDELDEVVDTAMRVGGDAVFGTRMTGGGFGGSVLVLCDRDHVDATLRQIVAALPSRCTAFRIEPSTCATCSGVTTTPDRT